MAVLAGSLFGCAGSDGDGGAQADDALKKKPVAADAPASDLAGQTQTLECSGKMTDDNGYPNGTTWLDLRIDNPQADGLKKLDEKAARARLGVGFDTGYIISIEGAEISADDPKYLRVFGDTPSEEFSVWIPVDALGKADDKVSGVSINWRTGRGIEGAKFTCKSTLAPTKKSDNK